MATKKQKRLAGEQKQAINREESRRTGLKAQADGRRLLAEKRKQAEINRQKREEETRRVNAAMAMRGIPNNLKAADEYDPDLDIKQRLEAQEAASMAGGMD